MTEHIRTGNGLHVWLRKDRSRGAITTFHRRRPDGGFDLIVQRL